VVAFITSLVLGLLAVGVVFVVGKRRPMGTPLSWGEAMFAATYAFLVFFWWYGVIPNQWLQWATNELNWGTDKFLAQSGQPLFGQEWLSWWPLDVNYAALKDTIVMGVYGLGIALHLGVWAFWQDRSKERAAVVPASRYGRPLVRKG